MPTETPLPRVTAVRRFPELDPEGTPLTRVIAELTAWMRRQDAAIVGGARGAEALTPTAELQTNVTDAATVAGKPALGVAATYATEFMETFDAVPVSWVVTSGALSATTAGTGQTGGKALRQTGPVALAFPNPLPYDPSKLHRLRGRAKAISGGGTFTFGVQALDASGAVLGTYAAAANAATPGGSYVEYTGWLLGVGTPGAMPAADAQAPSALPTGTVSLRPYVVLNGGAPGGVMDLDYVSYERQDEEQAARVYPSLLSPSTTDPTDAARYATGARTVNNAIDTGAVQIDVVLTARVESTDDPTIFLDFRTGLAPTALVFSHPALALYVDGTAVFGGEVSAASFTAPSAAFANFLRLGADTGFQSGILAIRSTTAAGDVLFLRARDVGGVPAVTSNIESLTFPLTVSSPTIRLNADPISDTDTAVTIKGTLNVTGGISGVSGGSGSFSGSFSGTHTGTFSGTSSGTHTGTFSGAVSASSFTYTGGAVSITGSRTTNVDSVLDQLLNALAARGFVLNNTTP